jgi:cbb3-type cytochrome oxidase maturation protein
LESVLRFSNDSLDRRAEQRTTRVMTASIVYTFGIGILIGVAVLMMFIWGASTGAFDHAEDAKYILFRDDDDD